MPTELSQRLTRRHFVVGGLVGAGGAPFAYFAASAPGANAENTRLFGVVDNIKLPRRVVLRSDGRKTVELNDGASLWRDRVVELDAFRVGDEVALEGEWDHTIFRSTHMSSAYRYIDGVVRRRSGDVLELPQGRVHLSTATIARGTTGAVARPVNVIGTGDRVVGIGRWDPASNDLLALQLGVRVEG